MASLNLGMLGAYAGAGVLSGIGQGMDYHARLDDSYKMSQEQTNHAKELQDNKAENDIAVANSTKYQLQHDDPISRDIAQHQADIESGKVRLTPAVQPSDQIEQAPGATSVPGSPIVPNPKLAMPQQNTAPMQGQGQMQQSNLVPQQGSNQSVPPTQMAQNTGQANDAQGTLAPPETVDKSTPAAKAVVGATAQAVTKAVSQGADPTDVYIDSFKAYPQLQSAMKTWKVAYQADSPEKLQALEKAQHDDPAKFTENAVKLMDAWNKESNTSLPSDDQFLAKRANDMGVPFYKDSNFYSLHTKQQEAEFTKQQGQFEKESNATVPALQESLGHLQKIVGMIGDKDSPAYVDTGGLNALPGAASFRAAVDTNAAEFQKEAAYVTLRSRPTGGYSRVTNADLNMFQKASPNFNIPNEANYYIASGLLAERQDEVNYFQFKQSWLDAYHHIDQTQVDKAWKNYQDNNPIFDPKSNPQAPKLNANRQPWQEYFQGKSMDDLKGTSLGTQPQQQQSQTPAKTINFSDLPK